MALDKDGKEDKKAELSCEAPACFRVVRSACPVSAWFGPKPMSGCLKKLPEASLQHSGNVCKCKVLRFNEPFSLYDPQPGPDRHIISRPLTFSGRLEVLRPGLVTANEPTALVVEFRENLFDSSKSKFSFQSFFETRKLMVVFWMKSRKPQSFVRVRRLDQRRRKTAQRLLQEERAQRFLLMPAAGGYVVEERGLLWSISPRTGPASQFLPMAGYDYLTANYYGPQLLTSRRGGTGTLYSETPWLPVGFAAAADATYGCLEARLLSNSAPDVEIPMTESLTQMFNPR